MRGIPINQLVETTAGASSSSIGVDRSIGSGAGAGVGDGNQGWKDGEISWKSWPLFLGKHFIYYQGSFMEETPSYGLSHSH